MRLILKNGIVYDPINKINGEKMDICIENGKIVEDVRNAKIIDVKGKLVLPGGIDVHSHIAGSKVNWGRLFRPEDNIRRLVKREENIRGGSGYSVPTTFLTGYDYARLGYTFVVSPAMPPLLARHTHHELNDIPIIDKATLSLFDGNWIAMELIKEGETEKLISYVAWLLKKTKGFSVKLVNPGGTEAWGWGKYIKYLDDQIPYFDITPRDIIRALTKVCEYLHLPHSIHLHCNNLGNPGNFETTLETIKTVRGIKAKNRQVLHLAHVQFHSYGGDSWKSLESKSEEIAKRINKQKNVTIDTGNIIFGETTTMTADGPLEFHLHLLTNFKWINKDIELETSPGVTPFIYSPKSPVHSIQWAIGIELALLVDPNKVIITTDHPNGGRFTEYPRIIAWLMSKKYREETLKKVNTAAERRGILPTINRELTFYEIAQLTRSNPARVLGLEKYKGHLGAGADADISVYEINPQKIETNDYETIIKSFSYSYLTLKSGKIVVKKGRIIDHPYGKTYWVDAKEREDVTRTLHEYFTKFYSVRLSNYAVQKDELRKSERICVE